MELELSTVAEVLKHVLERQDAPLLGATLKQRLNAGLLERGYALLDERKLGFSKFSELLKSQAEWLDVRKPEGAGDVSVVLRKRTTATESGPLSAAAPAIRSDIWQAFTNPDPSRKRFFARNDNSVIHFLAGDEDKERLVQTSAAEFVNIKPISGDQQLHWMKEFLTELPMASAERAPFDAMLQGPYTSALNVTFTRALGADARAWREFRTKRITECILAWAKTANIQQSALEKSSAARDAEPIRAVRTPPVGARDKVIRLLDLLGDDELDRVVIPLLLSTILVKSKLS